MQSLVRLDTAIDTKQLLSIIAAVEAHSAHPLADALVGYAAAQGANATAITVQSTEAHPGLGVTATVCMGDDTHVHTVSIGSAALVTGAASPDNKSSSTTTAVYVGIDSVPTAYVTLSDTLCPPAATVVEALNALKLTTVVLTGDAVQGVASALPLHATHVGLLPNDKLAAVERYASSDGPVMHVGDGINDAPALAAASVGVAMGRAGAALAVEAADVALFGKAGIDVLPGLIKLGRRVRRKIWENIVFAVMLKIMVLVLAALHVGSLWLAVAVDAGTAVLVVLNGMTLLRAEVAAVEKQPRMGALLSFWGGGAAAVAAGV